jgi:GMP synthase (glutamine-hydrolyzing) (EC 6.3.5.2)
LSALSVVFVAVKNWTTDNIITDLIQNLKDQIGSKMYY